MSGAAGVGGLLFCLLFFFTFSFLFSPISPIWPPSSSCLPASRHFSYNYTWGRGAGSSFSYDPPPKTSTDTHTYVRARARTIAYPCALSSSTTTLHAPFVGANGRRRTNSVWPALN
uniref:Putative secreted protein n=1 Tax=Anopheles darlingi TaxID=43151 RepID=A0A2M4DPH4_ANODA